MKKPSLWLLLFFSAAGVTCTTEVVQGSFMDNNETVEVDIGVIYDEDSAVGRMGLRCMEMALSDFHKNHGHHRTRIKLHSRSFSKNGVVGAALAALYLLKNVEVKAIIGPTTSMEAEFVMNLGEQAHVPIISYAVTSPLVSFTRTSYFIHMSQDDLLQAELICALVQVFGWREVVPIYVKGDYESAGFIHHLADALQVIDARISYHGPIDSSSTDDQICKVLDKLKRK